MGFKGGGYTGDGDQDEEAGPVHKEEWVFEAPLVKGHKKEFAILHKMLRAGITMKDVLANAARATMPRLISPEVALAGVNLVSPSARSSSFSDSSRIEKHLEQMNARLEKIEKNGFNAKIEVEDIHEEIRGQNIYRVFKLREKVENKKKAGGN